MYFFSAAAEDEELQKKGIVCVIRVGPACTRILFGDPSAVKVALLIGVIPVRVDAIHVSGDKSSMAEKIARLFPKMHSLLSSSIRVRSRYYSGTCSMILDS
jgi:hypothetical protein